MFQCAAELVGTGGGFIAAADAVKFLDDVVDFLAGYQAADTLQVAVAAAIEGDLLDDAVVIHRHIDKLRAGTLGFVEEVFHIRSFFSVATSSSLMLLPNCRQILREEVITYGFSDADDTIGAIKIVWSGLLP